MASSFLPVQTTAHLVNEDSQWLRTEWDGRAGALAKGRTGGGVWQAPQASSASPSCPALRYCLHNRLQQQQLTGRNTATTNRPGKQTGSVQAGWLGGSWATGRGTAAAAGGGSGGSWVGACARRTGCPVLLRLFLPTSRISMVAPGSTRAAKGSWFWGLAFSCSEEPEEGPASNSKTKQSCSHDTALHGAGASAPARSCRRCPAKHSSPSTPLPGDGCLQFRPPRMVYKPSENNDNIPNK